MAKNVQDIDMGWEKFQRFLREGVTESTVGIQGTEASGDHGGITNAELAGIHEFGAPRAGIPERSFIRSSFDENESKYLKDIGQGVANAILGANFVGEMRVLGEDIRKDILNKMRSGVPPPLKPATVRAKKGDTQTLIDTGQLLNSITAVTKR